MNSWTAPSGSLKSSITSWASRFVPNVSLIVSTVSVMYVSESCSRSAICEPTSVPIAPTNTRNIAITPNRISAVAPPPPPTPSGQPVDAGLDGERQEHRDGEEHEEAAQLAPEEPDGHRPEEPAPEDDDGRDDPPRQAAVLRRGDEVVLGPDRLHRFGVGLWRRFVGWFRQPLTARVTGRGTEARLRLILDGHWPERSQAPSH